MRAWRKTLAAVLAACLVGVVLSLVARPSGPADAVVTGPTFLPDFNPETSSLCAPGFSILKFVGGNTFNSGNHDDKSSGDPNNRSKWNVTGETLTLTEVTINGQVSLVSQVIISDNGNGEAYKWDFNPPETPSSTMTFTTSAATTPQISPMADNQYFFICAAQRAKLTLQKVVNGGAATPNQWTLAATGVTSFSGQDQGPAGVSSFVGVGQYTLSESGGPSGYAQSGPWVCTGGGTFTAPDKITLTANNDVTCTVTNAPQNAQLTLIKTVTNDNGGGAAVSAFTLTASGPTNLSGVTGAPAVTNASVSPGNYTLSETGGPTGYTASTYSCVKNAAAAVVSNTITLAGGDVATCTINNNDNQTKLTLVKNVVNDNGGTALPAAWTLTATGPTNLSGATATAAVTNANVNPGNYTLSETGGPAGYTATQYSCVKNNAAAVVSNSITLALGDTATCTITNNDNAAKLTLVKTVINDNAGTAVNTAWTLTAAGPTPLSGVTGNAAVTNANVNAGTYTLSESGGPGGYTAAQYSCVKNNAAAVVSNSITLALGDVATCTITNNDDPTKLTLLKTVTNNSGGTALNTAFTLKATNASNAAVINGTTPAANNNLTPGTFTLSETGPAGYTGGSWSCVKTGTQVVVPVTSSQVTLALGDDVTCTIDNDDDQAKLTLVKQVTNNNGGTALNTAWTLKANGPTSLSGITGTLAVTAANVDPGSYSLSETGGPAGYTASTYSCVKNGGAPVSGNSITLALGDTATCTITNDDDPVKLTLIKTVTNDNAGTAAPTAFTLKATNSANSVVINGPTPASNANLSSGAYTLSETGPSGYSAGVWSCVRTGPQTAVPVSNNQVTLALGDDVTCTINNNDDPTKLTLIKTVTNNNGGTANPGSFTLKATNVANAAVINGPTPASNANVTPGVFTLSETGPGGYTASAWSCVRTGTQTVVPVSGSQVTLALGDDVTCTINNNDNPAKLTLRKTVTNDNGGTAANTAFTLKATSSTNVLVINGATPASNTSLSVGTYTLSESGPAGYTAGTWSCEKTVGGASVTVTNNQVALGSNDDVTCTINNNDDPAKLTLKKTVTNNNGGTAAVDAFTLKATNSSNTTVINGQTPVSKANLSVGTYTLSETGVSGYTGGTWSCEKTAGGAAVTVTNSQVTLGLGDDITCTINNDDDPAKLTLKKTVTNNNGGTAVVGAFMLKATNSSNTTVINGQTPVSNANLSVGTYTLSETGVSGYTGGTWSCEKTVGGAAVTVTNSQVTLGLGDDITCTINNDDDPAKLTLIKTVTNDNGGSENASAWTLKATNASNVAIISDQTPASNANLSAGTYTLSEVGPAGYTGGAWTCRKTGTQTVVNVTNSQVTLGLGDDVTCTINNDDNRTNLTLIKTVTNNSGGTEQASAWTLRAAGPTTITGATGAVSVTDALVNPGTYTLSETGPAGYTGTWSCRRSVTQTPVTVTNSRIALSLGDDVTCTINNDDNPAILTLVKTVTNDGGGNALPTAWTLSANGPTALSGKTGTAAVTAADVNAGSYTLGETGGPAGYTPSTYSCVKNGGAAVVSNTISLALGDQATCTINNDDQRSSISIKKTAADGVTDTQAVDYNGTATFKIVVTNTGESTLTSVNVTDVLAPNCAQNIGTMTAGQSVTINCTLANITAGLTNVAAVTAVPPFGANLNESDTSAVTVLAPALTLTKAAVTNPISAGDTAAFLITVSNAGPGTAAGVRLADQLPIGSGLLWQISSTSGLNAACAISGNPATLNCGPVDMPANSAFTVTISSPTTGQTPSPILNTANLTATNHGNLSASAQIVIAPAAIAVSKVADAASVRAGSQIGFVITVTNNGTGNATGVKLTDTLQSLAGLTWTIDAANTNGPSCAINAGVLTCGGTNGTTVAPGASYHVHVVSPTTLATPGSVPNTASVTTTNDGSGTSNAVVVVQHPSISVAKTVGGGAADTQSIHFGTTATFQIVVSNTGDVPLTEVTVTDALAPGCARASLGTLAVGASTTYTCTLANVTSGFVNSATATGKPPIGTDVTASDTSAVVVLAPSLTLTKRPVTTPISAGDVASFEISVSNAGPGNAVGVTVSDPLPTGAGLNWSIGSTTGVNANCAIASGTLTCGPVTLAPTQSFTVTITSPTTAQTPSPIANTANLTATNHGELSSSAQIQIQAASIAITKVADATPVPAGQQIGFVITVTNNGPGSARGVRLSDTLPAGLTWTIDAPKTTGPQCVIAVGVLTCGGANGTSLAAGASYRVHIVATTDASNAGTITNTAGVTTTNDGSGSASATVVVTRPIVSITKTAAAPSITQGAPASFSIVVSVSGTGTANGVTLNDPLPVNPDGPWVITSGPPACAIVNNVLSCPAVNLAAPASFTVVISTQTGANTPATLLNTATVSSGNAGTAQATASIAVQPPTVITIPPPVTLTIPTTLPPPTTVPPTTAPTPTTEPPTSTTTLPTTTTTSTVVPLLIVVTTAPPTTAPAPTTISPPTSPPASVAGVVVTAPPSTAPGTTTTAPPQVLGVSTPRVESNQISFTGSNSDVLTLMAGILITLGAIAITISRFPGRSSRRADATQR